MAAVSDLRDRRVQTSRIGQLEQIESDLKAIKEILAPVADRIRVLEHRDGREHDAWLSLRIGNAVMGISNVLDDLSEIDQPPFVVPEIVVCDLEESVDELRRLHLELLAAAALFKAGGDA